MIDNQEQADTHREKHYPIGNQRRLFEGHIQRSRSRAKEFGEHQSCNQTRLGINANRPIGLAPEYPCAEHRTKPENNCDQRETCYGV